MDGSGHAFLNELPEPLLLIASDGALLAANRHASRLFGFAPGEPPPVTFCELTEMSPAEVAGLVRECMTTTMPMPLRFSFFPAARAPRLYCCEGWRCNGVNKPAALIRIHSDERGISRFMELARLIDTLNRECEQRRLSEQRLRGALAQLHEIDSIRTLILQQISHDLRTPLNAILGMSEFILQEPFGPLQKRYGEYISDIHFSGRTLLELVDQVLHLGDDMDPREASDALADLSECVDNCRRIVEPIARQRGLRITVPDPIALPRLHADQTLVKQILLNLMGNAAKYVQKGGRIEVRAEWQGDGLAIRVIDNGPGIPRERLKQLLRHERRQEKDFPDIAHSTGIGLSLSQRSAESIGARLEIDSRLGRGTTASLILPRPLLDVPH